jgi:hypothetical protein
MFYAVAFCATVGLIAVSPSVHAQQPQQKTVKACEDEWKANKAANQAAKITQKKYVVECRAGAAPAPAKPVAVAPAATAPAGAASKPAAPVSTAAAPKQAPAVAGDKTKDGTAAMRARQKECGAEWKADKAAGKTGSMKWPQYWSACNTRKKAA